VTGLRYEAGMMNRRTVLVGAGALMACGPSGVRPPRVQVPGATFPSTPFSYGVASGDPTSDAVVLWTALEVDPTQAGESFSVGWEVAADERFERVLQSGLASATGETGHTVHVDVTGLAGDGTYFYRFVVPGQVSPIGRTRTLRASGAPSSFRFGIGSCQDLRGGYFTAHRAAAAQQFDLFFFLGDFLYERNRMGVRAHQSAEPVDLAGYRARHAEYRRDADLQANLASCPWVVTWDDHEVVNNYGGLSHGSLSPEVLRERRRAAYRAYAEWMPLRVRPADDGSLQLFRGFEVGSLLSVSVLDTRQYRNRLVCGGRAGPACADWGAEDDSMLGQAQREWLEARLRASSASWNVLAQQVVFSDFTVGNGAFLNHDQWDGYPVERRRLLDVMDGLSRRNTIVLTGDIHLAALSRVLRPNTARATAVEIVTNSISSGGSQGEGNGSLIEGLVGGLPGLLYAYEGRRGYTACTVTDEAWQVDFEVVDSIDAPGGAVSTHASFEVNRELLARRR
jgi:alkaline phosphatase D